jgi:hypothetical protein
MKPPIVIEIIPGLDFTTGTGEKSQGSPWISNAFVIQWQTEFNLNFHSVRLFQIHKVKHYRAEQALANLTSFFHVITIVVKSCDISVGTETRLWAGRSGF